MSAENRLTADQLAALAPGDTVTIESAADFGRPRRSTGTVVRIDSVHIVVTCSSPRGVRYVQRSGRRDGVRDGGGDRAELVNADPTGSGTAEQRRQAQLVDALYREWKKNRSDLDKLSRLRDAISECLDERLVEQH